jgi:hypothetical protein
MGRSGRIEVVPTWGNAVQYNGKILPCPGRDSNPLSHCSLVVSSTECHTTVTGKFNSLNYSILLHLLAFRIWTAAFCLYIYHSTQRIRCMNSTSILIFCSITWWWPIIRAETCCDTKKKLRGLSPRANYTDRATAASRISDCQLLRIKGATWSAVRLWLYHEIMQATSRSHPKSWKWKCSFHWTRRGPTQKV